MIELQKLLSYICHQDMQRSFLFLWNPPLLCARCTGFYGGILIGWSYLFLKTKVRIKAVLIITAVSLVIVALNVGMDTVFFNTGNIVRAITGFFVGICVGALMCHSLKKEAL